MTINIVTMKLWQWLYIYCAFGCYMFFVYLLESMHSFPKDCPVSTGFFYYFTVVVTAIRSYDEGFFLALTTVIDKKYRLLEIFFELFMFTYGIIEMTRNCVSITLIYYGWFCTVTHGFVSVFYIVTWKKYTTEKPLITIPLTNFIQNRRSIDDDNYNVNFIEENIEDGFVEEEE